MRTGYLHLFIYNSPGSILHLEFIHQTLFYQFRSVIQQLTALVFTGLGVYFWFFFDKANAAQGAMRTKVASITGVYPEPHWIDFYKQAELLKSFETQYGQLYPNTAGKLYYRAITHRLSNINYFIVWPCLIVW
jgi:hypothetical protein